MSIRFFKLSITFALAACFGYGLLAPDLRVHAAQSATAAPSEEDYLHGPPAPAQNSPVPIDRPRSDEGVYAVHPTTQPDPTNAIVASFHRLYEAQHRPRMAVFVNRELSDEVRDWKTSDVVIAAACGGSQVAAIRSELPSAERDSGPEDFMWQLEDRFLNQLLKVHVRLVDRSLILRLAAVAQNQKNDPNGLVMPKAIEMEALKGNADLLIELLVHRNDSALTGYEYAVKVFDINTGQILAEETSLRWDQATEASLISHEVITTQQGYSIVPKRGPIVVDRVAAKLAAGTMEALCDYWSDSRSVEEQ